MTERHCHDDDKFAFPPHDREFRSELAMCVVVLRGEFDISCTEAVGDGFAHAATMTCERVVVEPARARCRRQGGCAGPLGA